MLEITYTPNDFETLVAPAPNLRDEREILEGLLEQVAQEQCRSVKVIDRETKHQILRSLIVRMRNLALVRRVLVSPADDGNPVYF